MKENNELTGYFEEKAEVVSYKNENKNIVSCRFRSSRIASSAKPGQFIMVQVNSEDEAVPVLRRPFAVSYIEGDEVEFIFDVVGRGTEILSGLVKGSRDLNVLGPLGNGFNTRVNGKEKLLIAGGVGIAPVKSLMQYYTDKNDPVTLIWGNRNKAAFFDVDFYLEQNIRLFVATDDGSMGFEGNVLEMLKSEIKNKNLKDLSQYNIYVVGPEPMMKAVSEYISSMNSYCQVSLEVPMACGIGVCQGCAVRKSDGSGYYLVCKDGPVFNSCEIIME